MQTIDFIGYKRKDLKKTSVNQLRMEGSVPCVLYGATEHVHFHTPAYLLNKLVNTTEVFFVLLDIEGKEHKCILQEVQYHPVSDMILHADFRELTDGVKVKMEVPVKLVGTAPGVVAGGVLIKKRRTVTIKALPKNMPQELTLDISGLDLGKSLKVKDLHVEGGDILVPERITVVSVEVPRGLKAAQDEAAAAAEADEAAEEGVEAHSDQGEKPHGKGDSSQPTDAVDGGSEEA